MSLHQPATPLGPKSDVVSGARDLLEPKHRRTRRQFLVEGPQGVDAALAANIVSSLFVTDWNSEFADVARRNGIRVNLVTDSALAALTDTVSPQGVVALCAMPEHSLESVLAGKPKTLVICVGVSDPGNLGTIIRTAAATGADAVITTSGSADIYSGKVVRATAGTFTALPLISGIDDDVLRTSLSGMTLLATTGNTERELFDADVIAALQQPHAWLLGNEAHGLPESWLADGVMQVRIPMRREVESLNVASAATVCLFASSFAARFSS